jgi:S1-C subfamily serine protease
MITSNIYERVLKLTTTVGQGSAFTLEVNGVQYLVTAKHVLPDTNPVQGELLIRGITSTFTLECVPGVHPDADIAVLKLPSFVTPTLELPLVPFFDSIVYSQDIYFLGFPYGLALSAEQVDLFAFVKKGILSATAWTPSGVHLLYLDGFNNPGFSGGPVVFYHSATHQPHLAGVVSGYRTEAQCVRIAGQVTSAAVLTNTGIVLATNIKHAMEAIEQQES